MLTVTVATDLLRKLVHQNLKAALRTPTAIGLSTATNANLIGETIAKPRPVDYVRLGRTSAGSSWDELEDDLLE